MKELFLVLLMGSATMKYVYVVAANPEAALKKAKEHYPYAVVQISEELGTVII